MPRRSPALLLVHVVWATHRRRPVLPPSFDSTLFAILGEKAKAAGARLLAGGCSVDHVHTLVRLSSSGRLADVVQRLKGAAAHDVNDHAQLPERLHWQDGYWAETLGPADFQPLTAYLLAQRTRHDPSHPAERWQFDTPDWEPAFGGL